MSAYSDLIMSKSPASYHRLGEPSGTTANELVDVEENEQGEVTLVFEKRGDEDSPLEVRHTPLPDGRVQVKA